jgi:hypothetical protein
MTTFIRHCTRLDRSCSHLAFGRNVYLFLALFGSSMLAGPKK